jgi:hypothetical protein
MSAFKHTSGADCCWEHVPILDHVCTVLDHVCLMFVGFEHCTSGGNVVSDCLPAGW